MIESVRSTINSGIPTIAECGGFMYLHKKLTDKNGNSYAMAGVLDGEVFPTSRLQRFGYINMTAKSDSLLCGCGDTVRAHEFHYFDSSDCGNGFSAKKTDGRTWDCCHVSSSLYAGFPHINFYSDIRLAERFVRACIAFGDKNGQDK
jgi:cobyrinic acid a,c-diamide synthase